MSPNNHSSSEIFHSRRTGETSGLPAPINWATKPKPTEFRKSSRAVPVTNHATRSSPVASARDATRSTGNPSDTSSRQITLPTQQQTSQSSPPERRLSDASMATQLRIRTNPYQPSYQPDARTSFLLDSGRTTPTINISSDPQDLDDTSDSAESIERPRSSMSSRWRVSVDGEDAAIKAADADYHAVLRGMESHEPVKRSKNKLEKMFGSAIQEMQPPLPRRRGDHKTTERKQKLEQDTHTETRSSPPPPVPARSPNRPSLPQPVAKETLHQKNNSLDRSQHNKSVASTSALDSDLTNADSDAFSRNGDDASSFTSAISSSAEDTDNRHETQKRLPSAAHALTEREDHENDDDKLAPKLRINSIVANKAHHPSNQLLPTPPGAETCYDMLTMRSPTGVERRDFGASRDPTLALLSFHHTRSPRDAEVLALAYRPASPANSDASDAESFDSACPPPITLFRDIPGPKYRSRDEQKQAYKKTKKQQLPVPTSAKPSAKSTATELSPSHNAASHARSSKGTGTRASRSPKPKIDLTMRPSNKPSREPRRNDSLLPVSGVAQTQSGKSQKSKFPAPSSPSPSATSFSLSAMFGRKKEAEPALPPLRKITFDTRGQKCVVDINSTYGDDSISVRLERDFGGERDDLDSEYGGYAKSSKSAGSRPRLNSGDSRRCASSHGVYKTLNDSQVGWRMRTPGTPRRTAWGIM